MNWTNEKGVTLIEVIISATILSIVLITFFNFFPQMGLMNRQNEDKIQGVNMAKQIMVKWKESDRVQSFIDDYKHDSSQTLPQNPNDDFVKYDNWSKKTDYLSYTTTRKDLDVEVRIFISSERLKNINTDAHQVHVLVKNKRGNLVSESYGYVISK